MGKRRGVPSKSESGRGRGCRTTHSWCNNKGGGDDVGYAVIVHWPGCTRANFEKDPAGTRLGGCLPGAGMGMRNDTSRDWLVK